MTDAQTLALGVFLGLAASAVVAGCFAARIKGFPPEPPPPPPRPSDARPLSDRKGPNHTEEFIRL